LANRGYAVLQMNYRGSTGFGRKFWEASFKEWGKKMQDDISDGVLFLIQKGIADPKRVAIYGASYGGYATLAGLTFTPDLYCCGIDYVGVSNLFTLLESVPPYWKPLLATMYEKIGHPETEKELLKAASPLFHVYKIKAPLLVAQGANDPRVKKAESDQIVAALKDRGHRRSILGERQRRPRLSQRRKSFGLLSRHGSLLESAHAVKNIK
jgi:dipeptidyl aminopeptidase/acylaminoacyl peptidase